MKWPGITQTVKKGLAERAARDREALCGAEPKTREARLHDGCCYVQSPIALLPLCDTAKPESKLLDAKATRQFVLGRWRPTEADPNSSIRLRLFADCGMGKSVQLLGEHAKSGSSNGASAQRFGCLAALGALIGDTSDSRFFR